MTDAKLPVPHGTPFAPRALVPVAVGRSTVNLYPVIDPSMPVEERAHALLNLCTIFVVDVKVV
jgi:hypothetical protein